MLTLDRIDQTAIDETTRKISWLRYVTRAEAEEATMMALLWLQKTRRISTVTQTPRWDCCTSARDSGRTDSAARPSGAGH